ncbi:kinetochore protein [Colletotrichum truncatum]|uniref:Kinetochore protein n=1 Tax=Colletotrichum truncatum TaxID=5467 RepID=A0ACC3ZDG1_COLTU|nr:kinetochore protein [Colletotrichum truncatum]KAF6794697.1 kinetochore protein [Colletotrichum truncatum]
MSSDPAAPPTIIAQKQAFLTNQTRLLSQPLHPSKAWLVANETSESPVTDPVIEHVVARLNHIVTQHSRRAYSHQASRHVAEQIDALYLSHPTTIQKDEPSEGLSVSLDLTDDAAVKSLPATWPAEEISTRYPMEARRYSEQLERLKSLAEKRQQVKDRIDRLRHMKTLLDHFRSDESGAGVQENLVTRGGDVEREMEKMRVLLARVGGRVNLLPESTESGSLFREEDSLVVEPVFTGEKRKLDDLLDRF